MRRGFGGTMGQGQAGHAPRNPPGVPRVSGKQVKAFAKANGYKVHRDGIMWLIARRGTWFTLGDTNYLALERLRQERDR